MPDVPTVLPDVETPGEVVAEVGVVVASEADADAETEEELGDEDFVSPSSPLMSTMSSVQAARRRGKRKEGFDGMADDNWTLRPAPWILGVSSAPNDGCTAFCL